MLTARGRADDVLRGFEAGADDYLAKPFELAILLARVNGLLRRRRWNERRHAAPADDAGADSYTFAGRVLDFGAMEVRAPGRSFRLTQMESELLRISSATPARPCRAAPSSRTCGTCTEAPTPAPSTTSSSVSDATSRTSQLPAASSSRCGESDTGLSRRGAGDLRQSGRSEQSGRSGSAPSMPAALLTLPALPLRQYNHRWRVKRSRRKAT